MEKRVKDLFAQQDPQKMMHEKKPEDMTKVDCEKMDDKAANMIHLCVLNEVMYHMK